MQLVDRLTDLLDGRVDVVDGVLDPWLDRGMRRQPACGLQGQTGGEEALDDVVVHVAGDAVPVVQQRHEGPVPLRPPGQQASPACWAKSVNDGIDSRGSPSASSSQETTRTPPSAVTGGRGRTAVGPTPAGPIAAMIS